MVENGVFKFETPIVSIKAINGMPIDGRGEVWKFKPYSSFVIPDGNTFVEIKKSRDGDFGYVHFSAKVQETYILSYEHMPDNRFMLTVTDSQNRLIDSRVFYRYHGPTSYSNVNALLDAIAFGDSKEVKRLLQTGADPNWHDAYGLDPLPLATLENNLEIVQILISAGASAAGIEGASSLAYAARHGNLNMAQMLIKNSADVNLRRINENSALMVAAKNGYAKIVQLLLEQGAYTQFRNSEGKTALALAEMAGHQQIVELIERYSN